ncbi:MAG: sterol desaturase family protein [Alphaproteobacteria bacterium]
MNNWLLANEPSIRLGTFVALLVLFIGLQALFPRRRVGRSRPRRWFANLAVSGLNALSLGLVFLLASVTAVGFAVVSSAQGWGFLNAVGLPLWVEVLIAFLLLDLVIYAQHVAFHHVPLFWRLHRMHHADLDFDVTTGVRFHPIEIVLSMGVKFAAIALIGAPALAVLIFEVMLNGTSLFNHANLKLPGALDRMLRWAVVTPDMHRVHHSVLRDETDSNFGFNLPWWDRLFGTYRAQPVEGHEGMTIGLPIFREEDAQQLPYMLISPFREPR